MTVPQLGSREDLRHIPLVTIDGIDARDFDDAVYCEPAAVGRSKKPNGWRVLVGIADVSHYVKPGEPLDREARERGTSVYLVDRVIPMLPFALSNGICSLNQGVDRLSMACEMQVSPGGEITSYEIVPAVIHVYRRLTYNIVNKVHVDKDPETVEAQRDLLPMLETHEELRNVMKAKRHRRGSIDFDIPEVKVKLDEKGHPIALIKREGSLPVLQDYLHGLLADIRGITDAYRQALSFITREDVAHKLFKEIAPEYAERNGGYTRIVRTGVRRGDAAETAIIELVK